MHKRTLSILLSVLMIVTSLAPFSVVAAPTPQYDVSFYDENGNQIASTYKVNKGSTIDSSLIPALPQGTEGHESYVADEGGKNHSSYSWDIDPATTVIVSNTIFTRIRTTEKHDYNFGKPQFAFSAQSKTGLMAFYECSKCGSLGEIGLEFGEINSDGLAVTVDASAIGGDGIVYSGNLDAGTLKTALDLASKVGVPVPGWLNTAVTVLDKVADIAGEIAEATSTCAKEGHLYGDNPIYTWSADHATCTATFTCTRDDCKSNYDNHTVSKSMKVEGPDYTDATCTEDGMEVYRASVKFQRGNDLDYEDYSTQYSTVIQTRYGHDYVYQSNGDATCFEDGTYSQICSRCGDIITRTEQNSKLTHTPGRTIRENIVAPTCTNAGSYDEVKYCVYCQKLGVVTELERKTVTVDKLDHNPKSPVIDQNDIKEATCEEAGYYYKVVNCSECGEELSRTKVDVAALGHKPKKVIEGITPDSCTAGASYTEKVVCERCGELISSSTVTLDPTSDHDYKETVVQPTCTEDGYVLYVCSRCGDSYKDHIGDEDLGLAMLEHDYEVKVNTPASCKASGEIVRECKYCHDIETEVLAKTANHSWTETSRDEPTCSEKGLITETCSVCGANKYTEIPKKVHFEINNTQVVQPTCNTAGYTIHTCGYCGETYNDNYKPATGHTYGDPVREDVVEATCTTPGSYNRVMYCTECGDKLSSEAKVIEIAKHDYNKDIVPATCVEEGYTSYTCKNNACNHYQVIGTFTHTIDHKLLPAVEENVTPASCTAAGQYDSVVYCSECHNEISRETLPINQLPHTKGAAVKENVVPATCTKKGSYDSVVYCTKCSNEISRTKKTLDIVAHTPKKVAGTKATCTTDGKTDGSVCDVCGKVLVEQEKIAKTGHNWNKWKITLQPTTTSTGTIEYTCSNCGLTRTEKLAKLTVKEATPTDSEADDSSVNKKIAKPKDIRTVSQYNKKWLHIMFDEVKGAQNYRVMYRKAGTSKWNYAWTGGKTEYYMRNLKTGGLYEFMFAAYKKNSKNEWERGAYSEVSYRYYFKEDITKLKAKKGAITVSWKKDKTGDGYIVSYATKKNMSDKKKVFIKNKKTTSYTIKNPKKDKTYYFRVRSVKKHGKTYYDGEYSGKEQIKAK